MLFYQAKYWFNFLFVPFSICILIQLEVFMAWSYFLSCWLHFVCFKVKKKREILRDDGTNEGWEEYYEYVYPDEQNVQSTKVCLLVSIWESIEDKSSQFRFLRKFQIQF